VLEIFWEKAFFFVFGQVLFLYKRHTFCWGENSSNKTMPFSQFCVQKL